jgi:nickel superoxide dismutase
MFFRLLEKLDRVLPFKTAGAHCDIPCGIYDPIKAQIAALSVVRMLDLMHDLFDNHEDRGVEFFNTMSRLVAIKEEHAEECKREIRVIWGDYIKAKHLEEFPQLSGLVHKIMELGSKSRQSTDRQTGLALVEAVNEFAEIFWKTKGLTTKKAKAPYAPGLEMVYPAL